MLFIFYTNNLSPTIFFTQVILSEGLGNPKGDFFVMNWGWGFGLSVAILVSGGVSGAHFNPAITLALAFVGKKMFYFTNFKINAIIDSLFFKK